MIITKIFLHARYRNFQIWGALLVGVGLVIALLPHMNFSSSESELSGSKQWLWITLLILSCVPTCFSTLYKEVALDNYNLHVIYLNGWTALFQFFFTLVLMPLCGLFQQVKPMDMSAYLYNSWGCYALGINGQESSFNSNVPPSLQGSTPDNCSKGFFFVNFYLFFNVIYDIVSVAIVKYGGANAMWLSTTVSSWVLLQNILIRPYVFSNTCAFEDFSCRIC